LDFAIFWKRTPRSNAKYLLWGSYPHFSLVNFILESLI